MLCLAALILSIRFQCSLMAFDEGTHGDGVGEAYGVQGIVKCHCEYGNS